MNYLAFFKNQTNIQPVKRSIEINSPQKEQVTKHNDHHDHDHDHDQVKSKQESHSEFDIQINYSFNNTAKIKEIKSHLLEILPLLKKK